MNTCVLGICQDVGVGVKAAIAEGGVWRLAQLVMSTHAIFRLERWSMEGRLTENSASCVKTVKL
jgi:hypothetical protein